MKIATRNKFFLIIVFFFILGVATFFFFFHRISVINTDKGSASEKPISCATDDSKCIGEHAKNLTNQLTGIPVIFAKHQCDGPHPCPTPNQESIHTSTLAIREYTKNPKLQVVPINGVTSAGVIYYCTKDNQCWKIEAKTNKIISPINTPNAPQKTQAYP